MFDVICPGHGSRVLLGPRSIDALVNSTEGVELHWTCWCGTHGVEYFGARHPYAQLAGIKLDEVSMVAVGS